MSILRSATRFDQENWFQMVIDKEVPSCEVTGILDGEPIDFSGGGNSAYTLITSEELDANIASASTKTVGTVSINISDLSDKALFVVVRDSEGIRNGYFAYYTAIAMIIDISSSYAINGIGYHCVENQLKFCSGNGGIFVNALNISGQTAEIKVAGRYDATNSGTINGTYVVEVYALEYPPNGDFNL